jgi:hypothetical protein
MFRRKPSKLVAVLVPLSTRPELTPDEQISLRHLRHYLGGYDKYMVLPQSLDVQYDDFQLQRFDDSFFGSVRAHNRLLVSPHFYKTFSDYEYIFIHHLDSIVLSDRLSQWCEQGWDFIAPPWIKYEGAPYEGLGIDNHCGNGGFSLRQVQSLLRVLRSLNCPRPTLEYIYRITGRRKRIEDKRGEDVFWGTVAAQINPAFRVAPFKEALKYAFECNPRLCLETNNGQLPFGGHAWPRYDHAFWETHLLAKENKTEM